jgi:hypothetical protein
VHQAAVQQPPAPAGWAKQIVARRSDRSEVPAMWRSRPASPRRKPRSRLSKRALGILEASAQAVRAYRCRFSPQRRQGTRRGAFYGAGVEALKNDCAPGQRARRAQSTSLLKLTACLTARCPIATRIVEFSHRNCSGQADGTGYEAIHHHRPAGRSVRPQRRDIWVHWAPFQASWTVATSSQWIATSNPSRRRPFPPKRHST